MNRNDFHAEMSRQEEGALIRRRILRVLAIVIVFFILSGLAIKIVFF
jgi:hypothetical protein